MATAASQPLVIAHRGASGYLPEHTLEAKTAAFFMGADYLEQDVVLTRDGQPVVLHDIHLDTVTDVARVYPHRARDDGRYYALDFDLEELRRLTVSERFDAATGQAVYAGRFPAATGRATLPTLADELTLIRGLERSTGRTTGIYVEIKSPAWHRAQGYDPSRVVLETLARFDYRKADDRVFLQCFNADEARRLREELKAPFPIVQLIGDNSWDEAPTDFDAMRTAAGMRRVAEYADAIGPWLMQLVSGRDAAGRLVQTDLMALARENGLAVHPYTFRADELPPFADSYEELLDIFINQVGVDGIFTDHADLAVRFINARAGR
ncbi:MAG: glycerophosphodiester phosphodiesterase [Gammaproteobacteria bacterium]|nr:glycerophosphodiester phosphodiesterase [Gammaproteobacteria bacterium]